MNLKERLFLLGKSSVVLFVLVIAFTSCTGYKSTVQTTNNHVQLYKDDFAFSDRVSSSATETKIIMIDWERLFTKKGGSIENSTGGSTNGFEIPIVGGLLGSKAESYAYYDLFEKNKGYDLVFYPSVNTKISRPLLGIGFLIKITKVDIEARMAKIKK